MGEPSQNPWDDEYYEFSFLEAFKDSLEVRILGN